MHISRRSLLTGAASLAAFHFLETPLAAQVTAHPHDEKALPPLPPDEPVDGPLFLKCGPMLGHVGADHALVWVKASNAAKATLRVGAKSDLSDARTIHGPALTAETAFAGVIAVPDLAPGTRYYYAVLLDGEAATLRPHASFTTAPVAGTAGKTRFAFVSCVGYRGYMAAAAWGEMAAQSHFEAVLMLGDNHYGNTSDLAKQRANYLTHRSVGGFRDLTARTSCYGIWDDHDYGKNDSDKTQPGKEHSLRAFKEFWANPGYGEEGNPGCYFKFTRGEVEFFMLDVRYHRSPDDAPKDENKTMLGAQQIAWLKSEIKASKAKVKFIATGSTMESAGGADSWPSYPAERRALLDFLREESGVIFISGDRHFTGGYQVEGRWIEITSGPLGSGNGTGKATPEAFALCNVGKLWSVFEVDTTPPEPKVAWELWMAGVGRVERREFTWDEVNGRAKIPPSPPLPKTSGAKKPANP